MLWPRFARPRDLMRQDKPPRTAATAKSAAVEVLARETYSKLWKRLRLRRCSVSGAALLTVVDRLALDALGDSMFTLLRTIRLRLFERASFASVVYGTLACTRSRWIVGSRSIRASGDESRASQCYPFHGRVSRGNCSCRPQCSGTAGAPP